MAAKHRPGLRPRRPIDEDRLDLLHGFVVRAGAPGTPTEVGPELNVTAWYELDAHTPRSAGYGHFCAGDFLEATGAHEDLDGFHGATQYTF